MGILYIFLVPLASILTVGLVLLCSLNSKSKKAVPHPVNSFIYLRVRKIVYACSLLWATLLFTLVAYTVPTVVNGLALLVRYFALSALFLIYLVLTPGLIITFFPRYFGNSILIRARRSIGISVFFFAFLHGVIAFFYNLAGQISSIYFLSSRNQWALLFSAIAFCILSVLAITSFDRMEKYLGFAFWKKIHRLLYVASIFVVFHAFFIGSHFTDPTSILPLIVNYVSLTFILLEVSATVKHRLQVHPRIHSVENMRIFIPLFMLVIFGFIGSIVGINSKYDPHAAHRKGYSKNYSLTVTANPQKISAGEPVQFSFVVIDKRNGSVLKRYRTVMEKLMHVVVVRKDLAYYAHVHPEYDGNGNFTLSHIFPSDGTYEFYVEYSPPDFYENVSIASVVVGSVLNEKSADLAVSELSKTVSDVSVSLSYSHPIRVNDTVDFTYNLKATTGVPLSDLEPYLGAFGHMSAVSEDMVTYAHVHPIQIPISVQDRGGPVVQFSTFFPKAGKYKLFTQFKRGGNVFVTDFVIEVL